MPEITIEQLKEQIELYKSQIATYEALEAARKRDGTAAAEAGKKGTKAYKDQIVALEKLKNLMASSKMGQAFEEMDVSKTFVEGMASIEGELLKTSAFVRKNSKGLGTAIESAVTLATATARESITKNIGDKTGFNQLQKHLMDAELQAIQMGVSFGQGWRTANADTNMFLNSLAKTISLTNETSEAVLSVRKSLKHAFGPDAITPLKGIAGGFKGVGSSIDLTTAALLISKATGTSHTEITNAMQEAHLDLGMSIDETAEAFGHISDAAKDSRLEFGKVMGTVMQSAKTLKFYGATVETITPLFKRFNESLKGVGKEGLTPKLLEDFVGGLKGMEFGTRALLSMAAPPGQAGQGVLGGGLAMEAALETGEGMDMVTQSLVDTLKKFSGSQGIITREEAIADPSLERSYIIQRQMLQKMTGIADAGQQNETLRAMQNIDKNGMAASTDAQATLEKLLSAGKKTAEGTATDLMKAQLNVQEQQLTAGKRILDVLVNRLRGTGVQKALQRVDSMFAEMAQSGRGGMETLKAAVSGYRQDAQDRVDTYGQVGKGSSKKEVKTASGQAKKAGVLEGQATLLEATGGAVFQKNLSDVLKRFKSEAKTDKDKANIKELITQFGAMGNIAPGAGDITGRSIKNMALDISMGDIKEEIAKTNKSIEKLRKRKLEYRADGKDVIRTQLEIDKLNAKSKFLGDSMDGARKKLVKYRDRLDKSERAMAKGSNERKMAVTLLKERQSDRGEMFDRPYRPAKTNVRALAKERSEYMTKVSFAGQEAAARDLTPAEDMRKTLPQGRAVPGAQGAGTTVAAQKKEEVTIRVKLEVDSEGKLMTDDELFITIANDISSDNGNILNKSVVTANTKEISKSN